MQMFREVIAVYFGNCSCVALLPNFCFTIENRAMWLAIPSTLGATFIALTHLREASRRFIHTSHEVIVH